MIVDCLSLSKLYVETGWEYLKDRGEKHRLTYFYKMNNGLTPGYLSSLVPVMLTGKGFFDNQVYVLTPISIIR
jgi:hypothetical protein